MAIQSKAQFLNEIHMLLKKRYKPKPDRGAGRLTVLEAVIYAICHEGSTREQANQALSRFKDGFFDWNEVRVSSLDEIQGALTGLSEPEGRSPRIRRFLRQLFDRTYGFTLEALTKKPLKDSIKVLQEYEALGDDYVLATVIQQSLGGHAIPVDAPSRRALERLGVVDAETDNAMLRALLERAVPKNRGNEFIDLIEELAHDTCVEGEPDCPQCELRKICPTALTRKDELHPPKAVAKPAKEKEGAAKDKEPKAAVAKPAKEAVKEPKAAKRKSGGTK
ncbi:MAG TPA: endonuclease [Isosphaeraceae bacterium]|nr:endonuclease [Isosphaeraceae bacterium]